MTGHEHPRVTVRLLAIDPPFETGHDVSFGLQDKRGGVEPHPATATTVFTTDVEVVGGDSAAVDFRGEHVNGKKGDRFLYLSWGASGGNEPFTMFARAKIKLGDIPQDLLHAACEGDAALACRIECTNAKGQPASGTVRHPDLNWELG